MPRCAIIKRIGIGYETWKYVPLYPLRIHGGVMHSRDEHRLAAATVVDGV
ncbi:hypothetical protein F9C07_9160 [Aspergillus flavus]|uniref:Uncharacterized protein n=1 Tax=Aspergillus flavus (strain ATCC 200026 / FGSC A1120 / IAM 13836 / NRRL 3357 / JCM 12722 / SRRC 167) TaxID=332952 RepID=A0A7U2MKF9_ASPFN|nr:hypothetical protein F9C07_9160 [Aspergillus flavus]